MKIALGVNFSCNSFYAAYILLHFNAKLSAKIEISYRFTLNWCTICKHVKANMSSLQKSRINSRDSKEENE